MRMILFLGMSMDLRYCTMLLRFSIYSSTGMCCLGFSSVQEEIDTWVQLLACW